MLLSFCRWRENGVPWIESPFFLSFFQLRLGGRMGPTNQPQQMFMPPLSPSFSAAVTATFPRSPTSETWGFPSTRPAPRQITARGYEYSKEVSFTGPKIRTIKTTLILFYCALWRPYLEYAIEANTPKLRVDIIQLERVQHPTLWPSPTNLCGYYWPSWSFPPLINEMKIKQKNKRHVRKQHTSGNQDFPFDNRLKYEGQKLQSAGVRQLKRTIPRRVSAWPFSNLWCHSVGCQACNVDRLDNKFLMWLWTLWKLYYISYSMDKHVNTAFSSVCALRPCSQTLLWRDPELASCGRQLFRR